MGFRFLNSELKDSIYFRDLRITKEQIIYLSIIIISFSAIILISKASQILANDGDIQILYKAIC
jgi:hypothetical protein